ncbi:hypothetical protein [Roseivirga pacifica]|uniref:hypothetical protein n=1 Tax=Roseivirga pacifica TaxID=1267423 RepID=UPI0020950B73|nr:hypothetical protein [Roseivirga pacifica]MCO6358199.1 hypothetical protein [Roseivirga pacifica]MCO6366637.1 hypothetical protein [Roseivirga pacifica]MCO6371122.1 hypothetical protein [Roseivirga pacifica]MCO6373930.1 hypothetical protein [Roseivirga pacifica]MCO6380911.1 hypothetical protein [Roseivirga pacifica]
MSTALTTIPEVSHYLPNVEHVPVYGPEILELMQPDGFNEMVQYIYQKTGAKETEAYEEAEKVYEHFFSCRRYEDYNSYKSSFHQVRKRLHQARRVLEPLPLFPKDKWPEGYKNEEEA